MTMAKLRLNRATGLEDTFYICEVTPNFWNVRVKYNHYTLIATVGYEHSLECLYKIVQKNRTIERLRHNLDGMFYPMNPKDVEKYNRQLKESVEYKSDVERVVAKAMRDYNRGVCDPTFSPFISSDDIEDQAPEEKPVKSRIKPIVKKKLNKLSLK